MPDEPVTIGDSTEPSMSFALPHPERAARAIPDLPRGTADSRRGGDPS